MSMSKRMYKDSPKIGKDENGKAKVEKGKTEAAGKPSTSEAASEVTSGTKGMEGTDHTSIMKDMTDRHVKETKAMHKKHASELADHHAKYSTGAEVIDKIESDKED